MRKEAHVILLAAGSGSRMTPLTGRLPKCLLPIGNYPMICYSLCFLQEAGYSEVTVVVPNSHKDDIKKLSEQFELTMKLDIAPINPADSPGTLDALRSIGNKIAKKTIDEVIIMSSDLITDVNLGAIMDQHLSKGAALTLLTAEESSVYRKSQPPGPKSKPPIGNDVICCESGSQRLLYAIAGGDYEETLNLPARVVSASEKKKFNLSTSENKMDAHLYIIKRWLFQKIVANDSPYASMDSLKAEVIPQIISDQFTKKKPDDSMYYTQYELNIKKSEALLKQVNTSTVESRFNILSKLDERVSYAYHHPGLCVRVNTLNTYWQINKEIRKLFDKIKVPKDSLLRHSSSDINKRAQICSETLIGGGAVMAEKTNISSSVIGNHARVKPLVRISNSLLFEYTTIEEKCVIENSIICSSINKPCTIKNSIVVDASKIEANGTYIKEILEENQDFTE